MDTLYVFGMYTEHDLCVEQALAQHIGFGVDLHTVHSASALATRPGVAGCDWKTPYKFVLCPQADQQGLRVEPDERTYFVETTNRTPRRVAQTIAELYTSVR